MSNASSLAKKIAEGTLTMVSAISALTGFNQSEIERLISQGEAALDQNRKEQVVRAQREIESAIRSRNW
ncbi:MAG: hypothetical protein Q8K13_15095 [Parvibaculum sp.]|uniref:hypothetical protein n=1 Tax=Parvibaculum sp. TaxID=2024848 RepID=UPI002730AB75|nr:hypothetical protein [Parvibaculum sp.]MDP2150962.1 hypothetical protein [Parvibaculum sp.]MDP3327477.1 hypothetical protein [Parvibaculum sp.]